MIFTARVTFLDGSRGIPRLHTVVDGCHVRTPLMTVELAPSHSLEGGLPG